MFGAGFSFSAATYFVPATVAAANNGTSLSGADVVLGNDVGALGAPGQFISNREIVCNAFNLQMNGDNTCLDISAQNAADIALNALRVFANATNGAGVARVAALEASVLFANVQDAMAALFTPNILIEHFNNGNVIGLDTSFDAAVTAGVGVTMVNGNNEPRVGLFIRDPGAASYDTFIGVDNSSGLWFVSVNFGNGLYVNLLGTGSIISPDGSDLVFSGAALDIKGSVTLHRFVSPEAASPVAVSATLDNYKVFTNEGAGAAITFNLPSAVAGLTYTFYVQNANGLVVDAAAGDTIRILALVTAAGGNVSSVTIGSSVTLVAINATEWVAISSLGTWV